MHSLLGSCVCVCGTNYNCSVYKTASSFFTCLTPTFRPDTHIQPFHSFSLSHPLSLILSHSFLFLSDWCVCVSVCVCDFIDTLLMEKCPHDPPSVSGVPQQHSQHISHPKAALQHQNTFSHTHTHHQSYTTAQIKSQILTQTPQNSYPPTHTFTSAILHLGDEVVVGV